MWSRLLVLIVLIVLLSACMPQAHDIKAICRPALLDYCDGFVIQWGHI